MSKFLVGQDFIDAAAAIGCDIPAVRAVDEVESRGMGFITNPDDPHYDEPTILFERHIFDRLTDGRYRISHPDISHPRPGGYGPAGGHQHDRLAEAAALDRDAALKSASWGRFQIMGFNYLSAGYLTLQSFINAMYAGEGEQLKAFVSFIKSQGLAAHLCSHNWKAFARGYNGITYWINRYHTKLANAWKRHGGV